MIVISRNFADELTEKDMRDAYLEEQTRTKLAQQIRALQIQRDLSQSKLGQALGKPQSNIARLEDREVARYTLSTLFELASAFDVGLVVEFVPYEEFLWRTHDLSPSHLQVQSFSSAALEPLFNDSPNQATTFVTENMIGSAYQTGSVAVAQSVIGYAPQQGMGVNTFNQSVLPQEGAQLSSQQILSSGQPHLVGGNAYSLGSGSVEVAFGSTTDVTTLSVSSSTTYSAPPLTWYAGADRRVANVG